MKVVIRADSGIVIGSGHIMRCLALAEELKGEVVFAIRCLPGNISGVIEESGYKIKMLPAELDNANIEIIDFLKQYRADILIVDNYDTGVELEAKARDFVHGLVVIDDLADKQHDCDMLLNQNPVSQVHDKYNQLVPRKAIKLLGLNYALLRKEFSKMVQTKNSFSINNILIFFGGSDHLNLTGKVLDAIIGDAQNLYQHICFNVVVGYGNPNKEKIHNLCKLQKNLVYHCQINSMAKLMGEADLYIGAGGTTNWERMCIGLPGIIISTAENQEDICRYLDEIQLIKYLGRGEDFVPDSLVSSLRWTQENTSWLQMAASSGKEMVDGGGVKRVAANIISLLIKFSPAGINDCKNVYNWRYVTENLRYSFNKERVPYDDHKQWFEKTIADKGKSLLIAYINDQPIGVVRFDYMETSFAEISLYLIPGQHKKGYGLSMLFAAERWLFENNKDISKIHAKVFKENEPSRKIFERAGYGKNENRTITYY